MPTSSGVPRPRDVLGGERAAPAGAARAGGGRILLAGGHKPQPSMVSLDPPAHPRLRKPTARAFTPRRVEAMEPTIRATVAELLDAIDPSAPFDLVSALTFPLPATIIFSFMGVPAADWPQLKEWCGHRATLAWGRPSPEEQVEHADEHGGLPALPARPRRRQGRRRERRLRQRAAGDPRRGPGALTHEEIASILFSLSFAGHETTNYLIGNAVRRCSRSRARWDAVVARPGADPRRRRRDAALRPVRSGVAAGDHARRSRSAASSSPRARSSSSGSPPRAATPRSSPSPRRSTPSARTPKHLAFGKGIHFCLGRRARQARGAARARGADAPLPASAAGPDQELTFHPNISFRGPQQLWVTVPT